MKNVLDVGGQAVIEGVMMKSLNHIAVAVRKADGSIVTKLDKIRKTRPILKLPIFRGFFTLIYIMILGMRALIWSSNQSAEEDEQLSHKEVIGTVLISLVLAVGIFVALPYIATTLLGINEPTSPVIFNIVDGLIKTALFIAYISLIALMPDIRRLFQYHGAEHKAVNCYEANLPLTPENAQKFTTIHPRCGTTFIVVTFVISIFIFAIVPALAYGLFPTIAAWNFWAQRGILFAIRIAFLPVVSGVSFEILKWGGRHHKNKIVNAILRPGFWFQKLTTREPDLFQLEVAIQSLKTVLRSEGEVQYV